MAGKPGRSGRPRASGEEMVAFATRVPRSEAEAFDAMVRRRSLAATGTEEGVSAAAVLRGLMKAAVEAERGPQQPARPLGARHELEGPAAPAPAERFVDPVEGQVEEPVPKPQKGSRR